jgi:tRNA wybutosine-synthesizing protein 3
MVSRFDTRKRTILEQLDAPDEEYHDLSPKGSIDAPIRPLISSINSYKGLVTTSSCSGRISVFLEGRKTDVRNTESPEATLAGPGGKGGGGSWLFISHDHVPVPVEIPTSHHLHMFGLQKADNGDSAPDVCTRYIHLKFEPMVGYMNAWHRKVTLTSFRFSTF